MTSQRHRVQGRLLRSVAPVFWLCIVAPGCFWPYDATTGSLPELALAGLLAESAVALRVAPPLPVTSGVFLQLDAQSAEASGGVISAWRDRGANALDVPASGAALLRVEEQINGWPVVRIPNSPAVFSFRRTSGFTGLTNTFTVYTVFRTSAGAGGARALISFGNGACGDTSNVTIYLAPDTRGVLDKQGNGNILVTNSLFASDVVHSVVIVSDVSGPRTDWYSNGALDIANPAEAGPFSLSPMLWLGTGCDDAGNNNFHGDVAELIVYARAISAAERLQLDCYSREKYGATIAHACP